jgi:hypothetical protein
LTWELSKYNNLKAKISDHIKMPRLYVWEFAEEVIVTQCKTIILITLGQR